MKGAFEFYDTNANKWASYIKNGETLNLHYLSIHIYIIFANQLTNHNIMNNQNSNPKVDHQGKPIWEFENDSVKGTEILGGGKGTVILPGSEGESSGETDSVDDGSTSVGEDGSTIPV